MPGVSDVLIVDLPGGNGHALVQRLYAADGSGVEDWADAVHAIAFDNMNWWGLPTSDLTLVED